MTAPRPPMPDTAHPDLVDVAPTVRPYLEERPARMAVRYATNEDTRVDVRVLTISRAAGPAPWTVAPYRYEWQVATDDAGRTIAGPAYLVTQVEDLRHAFRA